ncbi:hypothetical protein AYO42_04950 [Rhizomicrobium sp. SCGC AG-212-E05]|nr:hypothetical protein AYO42_04950 [Rhizomicrobium sp. SCGC AG-212-E05]
MKGLGKFQISQMRKGDPRVPGLFLLLRQVLDTLEDICMHPHAAPEPCKEPVQVTAAIVTNLQRDRLAYSIKEVRNMTGISNAKIYSDIKKGLLHSTKAGGRTLVLATDLQNWIESWKRS